MPIIQTNYGYVYKKENKSKKFPKILSTFGIIFIILVVCILGFCFFKFVPVFSFLTNRGCLISEEKKLYAISVYNSPQISSANKISAEIIAKNGAGYIFNDNNSYYVLVSCYENVEDAKNVMGNLQDYETEIKEITLMKLIINLTLESEQISELRKMAGIFYATYEKLYSLSVNLDNGVYSIEETLLEIENYIESCKLQKNNFYKVFNGNCDYSIVCAKLYYNSIIANLEGLKQKGDLSAGIKNTYLSVILMQNEFATNFVAKE